jgi:hypothetical protein
MIFCNRCGRKITAEEAVIIPIEDATKPNLIFCPSCAAIREREDLQSKKPSYQRGILFSIFGAAIGISIWYGILTVTNKDLSVFALVTGLLAAQFYLWGSRQNRNFTGQIIAAGITLIALSIYQYLSISYQVLTGLANQHYHNLPSMIPIKMAFNQTGSIIASDPFIVVVWLVAIWIAWFWTARKERRV